MIDLFLSMPWWMWIVYVVLVLFFYAGVVGGLEEGDGEPFDPPLP